MSTSTLSMLDQVELLQLAITSGKRNDSASTLAYLKEAVSREDASANAYFLLGAEYAEIGLYERAREAMEAAVKLDPNMPLARFQLALLLIAGNDVASAEPLLQGLTTEAGLADFAEGLLHLIREEFDASLARIAQGMQNSNNQPLNNNMQAIANAINQLPPEVRNKQNETNEEHLQHVMLSVYNTTQH